MLPARSANAVTAWLGSKPSPWRAGIRHVVIDPYQPYATAVAAQLPDALGFGFRNFDNYRLRLLLRCGTPMATS